MYHVPAALSHQGIQKIAVTLLFQKKTQGKKKLVVGHLQENSRFEKKKKKKKKRRRTKCPFRAEG